MRKLWLLTLLALTSGGGMAEANDPSEAENAYQVEAGLSCDYSGNRTGAGNSSVLNWHGFWFQGDGGWIFRGNARDVQGSAQLRGACGSGLCTFRQTYISGKHQGHGLTYRHNYNTALPEKGPIHLSLSGSWSLDDSYGSPDNWVFKARGGWRAKPRCQAVTRIGDLKKQLGWNPW